MSFRCRQRGLRAVLMACAVIVGALAGTSHLASAFVGCPGVGSIRTGRIAYWNTLWGNRAETAKGIALCEARGGEIEANTRGYLETIDLGDGAKIRLHAQVDPTSPYGSINLGEQREPWTLFRKRTAEEWYSWLRRMEWGEGGENDGELYYVRPDKERLFSVTNAGFFKETRNERPTLVPFPIVTWGSHSSLGVSQVEWERREVEEENAFDRNAPKKAFVIGSGEDYWQEEVTQTVKIETFPTHYEWGDPTTYLRNEGRPLGEEYEVADGLVAFTPELRVGSTARRNYLGVYGDTVYLFTSRESYTNEEANSIMHEIQPGMNVIQLDGGGSAQYYSAYGEMASNIPFASRRVANVLAVYRAR